MAPHRELLANPFAARSAGRVLSARTVPEMRILANLMGWACLAGTRSRVRTVRRRTRGPFVADWFESRMGPLEAGSA